MGLANRLVAPGRALAEAVALRQRDRLAAPGAPCAATGARAYEQWSLALDDALANEYGHGMAALGTGELFEGLGRYEAGRSRP